MTYRVRTCMSVCVRDEDRHEVQEATSISSSGRRRKSVPLNDHVNA